MRGSSETQKTWNIAKFHYFHQAIIIKFGGNADHFLETDTDKMN